MVLIAFAVSANAKVVPITVGATAFSPSNEPNVACGDSVTWIWTVGTHTVTSTTIPGGAAPWSFPINQTGNLAHIYIPTVAGTYNYKAAAPDNFTGLFVVTCTTSVHDRDFNFNSSVYPNPCTNKISIEAPGADMISIYNVVGEKIKSVSFKNGQTKTEFDVAGLNRGIYFYSIIKEGIIVETKKIIKN